MIQQMIRKVNTEHWATDAIPSDLLDDEEPPEKVYDWETIIANGPQFHYKAAFGRNLSQRNDFH